MDKYISNFSNPQTCDKHKTINCFECEDEALRLEYVSFLKNCGSCLNFIPFIAESGLCKIAESNCICKNPKAMINIWNDRCEKWILDPSQL